jgi:hypothetical protein
MLVFSPLLIGSEIYVVADSTTGSDGGIIFCFHFCWVFTFPHQTKSMLLQIQQSAATVGSFFAFIFVGCLHSLIKRNFLTQRSIILVTETDVNQQFSLFTVKIR